MTTPVADLLVVNARPWTDGAPLAGADAVALAGGRILAAGRGRELEALGGPRTRRLDARGASVTPGMCDAHIHILPWARVQHQVTLFGAVTRAEAVSRIQRFLVEHPGEAPVVGRGWDADGWKDRPERAALDAVTGGRPVLLHSKDYHALWVNSAALAAAGVTRATPDPPGGRIERDAAGEPIGVVRERAVRRFVALEAAAAAAGPEAALLERAVRTLHGYGITMVHDFDRGAAAFHTLRAMAAGSGPRLRVLKHLGEADLDAALSIGLESGVGDAWFRIGALKLFADGTLGSRTAAMLAPYDGTTERGMEVTPAAALRASAGRALAGGLSVAVHAIGDRACRSALEAFAAAGPATARVALPPRIEHAQLVDPSDLPRFADLGVAASMQPLHCTSDLDRVERWWASRREHAYPWQSLLRRGTLLAFGSDAPVESPGIAAGLHAAITRQRADGSPEAGFVPAERVTLDQALAAYTEGPARLAGLWPGIGSLRPGSAADLVVWSADLHRLEPGRLLSAHPVATVLAGEVVHEQTAGGSGPTPAAPASGVVAARSGGAG